MFERLTVSLEVLDTPLQFELGHAGPNERRERAPFRVAGGMLGSATRTPLAIWAFARLILQI
jgi:hypothetical protein